MSLLPGSRRTAAGPSRSASDAAPAPEGPDTPPGSSDVALAVLDASPDLVARFDLGLRHRYVNLAAQRAAGRSREQMLGRTNRELGMPAAVVDRWEAAMREVLRGGGTGHLEFAFEGLEGARSFESRLVREVDEHGEATGLLAITRDVTDRTRVAAELAESNERLADANAELARVNVELADAAAFKDDLLSMVSHELRTPLTPILGFLDVLLAGPDPLTDAQERLLTVVSRNARRMLRLVDDLLAVSLADADRLTARPETVDLAEAVRRCLDDLGETVPHVEVDVGDATLDVDPTHLHQILANLLTNAATYGASPVSVRAVPGAPGRLGIEVADHGPGIGPELAPYIWTRFVQGDRGNARRSRGVGLGLSIVAVLVEANAGTVGYRPRQPHGALFTVELPGTFWEPFEQDLAAVATPGGSNGERGEDELSERVRDATARLRAAPGVPAVVGVLVGFVQGLGGWTVPAGLADDRALPVDLTFGTGAPLLPAAPTRSTARRALESELPALVELARRVVDGHVRAEHLPAAVEAERR